MIIAVKMLQINQEISPVKASVSFNVIKQIMTKMYLYNSKTI